VKIITGYLRDRELGTGVSGKAVTFKNLAGADITSAVTYWQDVDAVTDADGRFEGKFELSPGPINVTITVSGSEVKKRMHDEQAQYGSSWSSDLYRAFRGNEEGVIDGFLNELAVSCPGGHTIRIATGGARFNGGIFTIENGPLDIAGTANPSGVNPRLDLVTLRQYNADAAGQDAGRQTYVVTEGTVANTIPATPTGSSFVDFPLAAVSTAVGAGSKTVHTDLREFPGGIPDTEPKHSRTVGTTHFSTSSSYVTWITPTITGLDTSRIYDGELIVNIHGDGESAVAPSILWGKATHANLVDGGFDTTFGFAYGASDNYGPQEITFFWPIIGLTGVTSLSFPLQLKDTDAQFNVYGDELPRYEGSYAWIRLRPRP
jgi:hypothetical protein